MSPRPSCPFGKPQYPTKKAALAAHPDARGAERCGRCRQWHPVERRKGRRG